MIDNTKVWKEGFNSGERQTLFRVREAIEKVQFNSWQDKKKLLKLLGIAEK